MKKIIPALVCACIAAAFAQQPAEPVYLDGFLAGLLAHEYAENGTKEMKAADAKEITKHIQNGRLYFLGVEMPVKTGKLVNGFEFVSLEDHKIRGVYNGRQTDEINFIDALIVAGYAESGKVVITHVFLDEAAMEAWAKTVKLASDQ